MNYQHRPTIVRMHTLAGLLRAGGRFSAREVAQRFEVSRRTIVRDLDYLRDQLGYAATWDAHERRYILHRAPRAQL